MCVQVGEQALGLSALTSVAVLPANGVRSLAFAGSSDCQVPRLFLRRHKACVTPTYSSSVRRHSLLCQCMCSEWHHRSHRSGLMDEAFREQQVYTCDAASGAALGTWLAHDDAVSDVAMLHGADARLLTASWDGTIRLWR